MLNTNELIIFSSKRALNEFLTDDDICPSAMLIGDFFKKIIFYKGKTILPKGVRKILLAGVLREYDEHSQKPLDKIGLVFEKSFLAYLESSSFLLQFFDELMAHKVKISDIQAHDICAQYVEHLDILGVIFERYQKILDQNNWVFKSFDFCLLDELLPPKIEMRLDGMLNAFELEILRQVAQKSEVNLRFRFYDFAFLPDFENLDSKSLKKGNEYLVRYPSGEILEHSKNASIPNISAYKCSSRINQVGGIKMALKKWLANANSKEQIDEICSNICVVLPDESFCKYLEVLDFENNLNYAMGRQLASTIFFNDLKQKCTEFVNLDVQDLFENLREFVTKNCDTHAKQEVLELLLNYEKISSFFENFSTKDIMDYFLSEISGISISDSKGGKVRVMGALETRGLKDKFVVLLDCNKDKIPSLKDSDLFLNSNIRKALKMPTFEDKKLLQLHYYENLLLDAKEAIVLFVENDESTKSTLLDTLDIQAQILSADIFEHSLKKREFLDEHFSFKLKEIYNSKLSASSFNTLIACPRKFYFQYILGLNELDDNSQARVGTNLHKILHHSYRKFCGENFENLIDECALDLIKNECFKMLNHLDFQNLDSQNLDSKQSGRQKVQNALIKLELERFFENEKKQVLESGVFRILGLEMQFGQNDDVELGGFKFQGSIDRLQVDENGQICVIDYKYRNKFEAKRDDFSLEIYRQVAQKMHPKNDVSAFFYDLKNAQLVKDKEFTKGVSKQEKLFEQLKQLDSEITEFKASLKGCKYCPYTHICGV